MSVVIFDSNVLSNKNELGSSSLNVSNLSLSRLSLNSLSSFYPSTLNMISNEIYLNTISSLNNALSNVEKLREGLEIVDEPPQVLTLDLETIDKMDTPKLVPKNVNFENNIISERIEQKYDKKKNQPDLTVSTKVIGNKNNNSATNPNKVMRSLLKLIRPSLKKRTNKLKNNNKKVKIKRQSSVINSSYSIMTKNKKKIKFRGAGHSSIGILTPYTNPSNKEALSQGSRKNHASSFISPCQDQGPCSLQNNHQKIKKSSFSSNNSTTNQNQNTNRGSRAFSLKANGFSTSLSMSSLSCSSPTQDLNSSSILSSATNESTCNSINMSKELNWYRLEELDHYYKILEHVMEETSANIFNVIETLQEKFIILSGGCTKKGSLIFTFTDNCTDGHDIKPDNYRKAIDYFCNIPSESDKNKGFSILIDRRNDKWSSVKSILILIQEYFPAKLNSIFILRPQSYFQRVFSTLFFQEDSYSQNNNNQDQNCNSNQIISAESNHKEILSQKNSNSRHHSNSLNSNLFNSVNGSASSNLIFENTKYPRQNLNIKLFKTVDQLYEFVEKSQLTTELGGNIHYRHQEWIEQRQFIEKLSCNVNDCVANLSLFIKSMEETDFPNDVNSTQQLIHMQIKEKSDILDTVVSTRRFGETVLDVIERTSHIDMYENKTQKYTALTPDIRIHYHTVFNLLKLMEESEKTLNMFWENHYIRLNKCLDLRKFERKFKNVRINLLNIFDKLNEINDENLLREEQYEECIKNLQNLNDKSQLTLKEALSLHNQGLQLLRLNSSSTTTSKSIERIKTKKFLHKSEEEEEEEEDEKSDCSSDFQQENPSLTLSTHNSVSAEEHPNSLHLLNNLQNNNQNNSNSTSDRNRGEGLFNKCEDSSIHELKIDLAGQKTADSSSSSAPYDSNSFSMKKSHQNSDQLINQLIFNTNINGEVANHHQRRNEVCNSPQQNAATDPDYDTLDDDDDDDDDEAFHLSLSSPPPTSWDHNEDNVCTNPTGYCVDSVEPKCNEIKRLIHEFKTNYLIKLNMIKHNRLLMQKMNIIEEIYSDGVILLNAQSMIGMNPEKARTLMSEIDEWLDSTDKLEINHYEQFNPKNSSVNSLSVADHSDHTSSFLTIDQINSNIHRESAKVMRNKEDIVYSLEMKRDNLTKSIEEAMIKLKSLRESFTKRQHNLLKACCHKPSIGSNSTPTTNKIINHNNNNRIESSLSTDDLINTQNTTTTTGNRKNTHRSTGFKTTAYDNRNILPSFSSLNNNKSRLEPYNNHTTTNTSTFNTTSNTSNTNNKINNKINNKYNNTQKKRNEKNSSSSSSSSSMSEEIEFEEKKRLDEKKLKHILNELIETERVYVNELKLIIDGYLMKFNPEMTENGKIQPQLPLIVLSNKDILFGNIKEIYQFHSQFFLNYMQPVQNSIAQISKLFIKFKSYFYLYSTYCLNKPHSEEIWREYCTNCPFFKTIQLNLGLQLGLDTYLLKPVQRISKYQLLLKELQKCCNEIDKPFVDEALESMIDVVNNLNDIMHASHIVGGGGERGLNDGQLGRLLKRDHLQMNKLKKSNKSSGIVNRLKLNTDSNNKTIELFLFEKAVIITKKKTDCPQEGISFDPQSTFNHHHSLNSSSSSSSMPISSFGPSSSSSSSSASTSSSSSSQHSNQYFYQFKESLKIDEIGITENLKNDKKKFELWSDTSSYIFEASNEQIKQGWVALIKNLLESQLNAIKYKNESMKQELNSKTRLASNNPSSRQNSSISSTSTSSSSSSSSTMSSLCSINPQTNPRTHSLDHQTTALNDTAHSIQHYNPNLPLLLQINNNNNNNNKVVSIRNHHINRNHSHRRMLTDLPNSSNTRPTRTPTPTSKSNSAIHTLDNNNNNNKKNSHDKIMSF